MGILNDFKKLFFGAKSVTKSAGDKAVDFGKDALGDVTDKAGSIVDKVADVGKDAAGSAKALGEEVMEKAGGTLEKAGDIASNVGGKVLDTASNVGEKVLEKGGDVVEKASEIAGDAGEKFMDTASNVGEKVLDVKDDLVEKAKELTGNLGEKLDDTIEKAQKMKAESDAQVKEEYSGDVHNYNDPKLSESMLGDDKDDFFSKAEAFAEGRYNDVRGEEPSLEIKESDKALPKPEDNRTIAGFEDLDGDGDELVDDAIIEEDEPDA